MIKKWSEYNSINENLQKARSVLRKLSISEDNLEFKKLRELLKNNTGYIGKFTSWMFDDKIEYSKLEDLFNAIKGAKLSKPIDQFSTPEEVLSTINVNTETSTINQMIGAIPSNTRDFLRKGSCGECEDEREIYCEVCDGNGTINCEVCDGDCVVMCKKCDGEGTKDCKKCKSQGTVECKTCKRRKNKDNCETCDGDEEIECVDCDGNGSIDCEVCEGNCEVDCPKCKGDGTEDCNNCTEENGHRVRCTACEKDTAHWLKLIEFFKSKVDNKELIIDYLSKKSARYGSDEFDYDDDEAVDSLIRDINMLINLPKLNDIIKNSNNEDDIRLIHDDDEKVIIAVNYNGIQKYGSSYWCIVGDEHTFDNYVTENCQQWIVFFKNKKPLLDDQSMMGITYNVKNKEVTNAHWEDDDECIWDARNLLSKIKLEPSVLIKTFSIYDGSIDMMFEYPEYFKDEIEKVIITCKEYSTKKSEFEESLIGRKGRKPSLPRDIEINSRLLISKIEEYVNDNGEEWNKLSTKIITDKCKELNFKIPVRESDADVVFFTGLYRSCEFNKMNFNIFDYTDDMDSEYVDDALQWLKENNYDFGDCVDSDNALSLYKIGVIDLETLMENFGAWHRINSKESIELASKIIENINDKNYDHSMFLFTIKALSGDDKLIEKYKDIIIKIINLDRVSRNVLESVLDDIDDDDIEMACARKLMHRKIATKYDIDMRRKVLERLMTFDKFKKG